MDEIWSEVLNYLGDTAVYIIKKDTHEILYFNKKVKEVTPEVEIRKVCHELWAGYCEFCPLDDIGEKKTNVTIGYGDPFGERVTISATKMQWGEEKIPAFLISITPRLQSKEERLTDEILKTERTAVYDSLPGGVARFLLGEQIVLLEGSRCFYDMFGTEEEFQIDGAHGIYPEDRSFVLENLYNSAGNCSPVTLEYRTLNRLGEIRWVRCEGKYVGRENGYPVYVLVIIDITKQKLMQTQLEQKQMEYQIAVESSADIVFEYYPRKDLFIIHKSSEFNKQNITLERYLEQIKEYQLVHPNDIYKVKELMESKLHREEVRVRLSDKDSFAWYFVQADALKKDGKTEKVIGTLRNIDEKKKMQQQYEVMCSSILAMYGEMLILNLEKGNFYFYKADEVATEILTQNLTNEFQAVLLEYKRKLIYPEDQNKFYDFFSIDAIRERVKNGEHKFYIEVRRKNDCGEYRWSEMSGTVIDNETKCGYNVLLSFRDIQELKEAKIEKEKADKRFVSAVSSFYDAIYEYDMVTDDIMVWKNGIGYPWLVFAKTNREQAFIFDLNYVREEYRKQADDLLSKDAMIKAFEEGRIELSIELPLYGNDNFYHWFAIQIQLLEKEEKEIKTMIYIKDIDHMKKEEKRKQDTLRDALALAEMSNSAKSEFLSRMSHDMRTPMNVIMGMSAIASSNINNPEKLSDCIDKIGVSANFLLSLINNVLDMAKIESGKFRLAKSKFNLRKLVKNVYDLCMEQVKEKNEKFLISMDERIEQEYVGDELRINQILLNLLSNAIKYTREYGTIQLFVDLEKKKMKRSYIKFRVKDNGIGMSREFLNRIFEPFEQENENNGRVFEGSGLGLSITQNLVHLMNGHISVESELGKGSEFTIILPLERVGQFDENVKSDNMEATGDVNLSFGGENVLLVEDSELNREIAQTLLEMRNLKVEVAENGKEAIERIEQVADGYYAAVLMDIRMPVMDGLEATKRIRSMNREDTKSIPIIAMTANAFQEEKQEAKKVGITEYLTKPIEVQKLYRILKQQIY
ncbi:PAS domain-containing hybrid sensor histidine kinase/response regulator [Velocimicrobium porci]|uniref:Circadian input-output histidine kinase CikA n=1 Tax=Velocimicrobium porci TaxID=2606634 RepID=A0A6L5XXN9_9FIRM|nr:ATP-binding protein [Velocimicrobium porci]MSS63636.1 response regulator [Velocimicrobium porci]